jgi:tRNA modification GTPase
MNASAECRAGVFSVLTPPGRGGIAVVRCFGPAAPDALAAAFRPAKSEILNLKSEIGDVTLRPRAASGLPDVGRLAYGHFTDTDGRTLDEIILYRAAADAFEVNCHGGPAAVEAVCRRLAALGLERVGPDRLLEFEGAALLERDARRLLASARTPLAARILLDQLNGALARALVAIAADLEAGRTADADRAMATLLARWHSCGRFLAEAPRVALAGRPNAGKSTLLNRLLGADRVLTSAAPGTTRDVVEADAALEGAPVVLVDTAGLHEAREGVERESVVRARREAAAAPLVVYLLDAAEGATDADRAALAVLGPRALAVWNKSDLTRFPEPAAEAAGHVPRLGTSAPALRVSALRGDGVDALGRLILARLGWKQPQPGSAVPFTPAQAAALDAARAALARSDPSTHSGSPRAGSRGGANQARTHCAEARKALEPLLEAPTRCERRPATK